MDEVTGIDVQSHQIALASGTQFPYDYLIIATGSTHSYFGNPSGLRSHPASKPLRTQPRFAAAFFWPSSSPSARCRSTAGIRRLTSLSSEPVQPGSN